MEDLRDVKQAILDHLNHSNDYINIKLTREQCLALLDSLTNTNEKKTHKKKSKKTKHHNAPTKPKTPYLIWLWDHEHGVAAEKAAEDFEEKRQEILDGSGKVLPPHRAAIKMAAATWRSMDDDVKTTWTKKADEDKARYEQEMSSYTQSDQKPTHHEPAPFGWHGPFANRFIRQFPKDADGLIVQAGKRVNKKYASFQEAVADANKLGDACTGITMHKRGYYTIRAGRELQQYMVGGSVTAEVSWSKFAPDQLVIAQTSSETTPAASPEPTPTASPEPQPDASPEPKPAASPDAEDGEDGEDGEDAEVEVEEFSVEDGAPDDGNEYYLDANTNKIYNSDSDHIANLIDGTFTPI